MLFFLFYFYCIINIVKCHRAISVYATGTLSLSTAVFHADEASRTNNTALLQRFMSSLFWLRSAQESLKQCLRVAYETIAKEHALRKRCKILSRLSIDKAALQAAA